MTPARPTAVPAADALLDRWQLQELTGIRRYRLGVLLRERRVPCVPQGGRNLYRWSDVARALGLDARAGAPGDLFDEAPIATGDG